MMLQPGLPPAKGAPLSEVLSRRPRQLTYGGGGPTKRLVCGYLACDARLARMLLTGLPPLVRVNVRGSPAGLWLETSVRYALGRGALAARRRRAACSRSSPKSSSSRCCASTWREQDASCAGWLAGVRDPVVGAALPALHERPASGGRSKSWAQGRHLALGTGPALPVARGHSPIQYLTQWRMLLASNLLCAQQRAHGPIAER